MNKFIIIALFAGILGLFSLSSCTKDPWVYDTSRKAGVYMQADRDTNDILFSVLTDTNWVKGGCDVYLIGEPVDYDREVKVIVIDSGTNIKENEDFIIEPLIFKAGKTTASLDCWARMPDRAEDENGQLHFTVEMVENDNFMPYICTRAYFGIYVSHQKEAPVWWDVEIYGAFSEKAYKKYMNLFIAQETQKTDIWQRYLEPVYGTNMYLVKRTWHTVQLRFLPYLKEAVLIPMFDYFTANPYPGVEIPQWYQDLKAEKNN